MVYGAKGIFKIDLNEVYVLISEFGVLKCSNKLLDLLCGTTFGSETFLATVKNLVFLSICGEDVSEGAREEFVNGIGQGNWPVVW